jgi:hypothetical protein
MAILEWEDLMSHLPGVISFALVIWANAVSINCYSALLMGAPPVFNT